MAESLAMLSEPEAAAVYALQAMQPQTLRNGHTFVLIDAGGGTVDLISYRIWGFLKLRMTTFNAIKTRKPMAWLSAWNYFELHAKRNYMPDEDEIFNIPLPSMDANARTGIHAGWMVITSADLDAIFAPIIAAILALVEGQLAQLRKFGHTVSGLVLDGGFGVVGTTVSFWTPYDPKIHNRSCKVWDPLEKAWKADSQVSWCIAKVETVSSTEPVLFPFDLEVESHETRKYVVRLISCDEDDGPAMFTLTGTPVACSSVSDLTLVPKKLWKIFKNSKGRFYQRLSFDVGIQIESGALSFDFRVNRVVYGKAIATFK
ncbi:hypothetical protein LTR56_017889 [Elasticomyces elasticus]|nr:hypothetical protein LTR56_017889 [Elasticomyces elasticus]